MKKPRAFALLLFFFSLIGLGLLSPYLDTEDERETPRFEPQKEPKEEGDVPQNEDVETIMIKHRLRGSKQ